MAEQAEIAAYLNRYSSRRVRLFLVMRIRETVSFRPSLDFRIMARTMESGDDTWQREEFEYAPWDGRQFIKEYRRTGRGPDGQPMEEVLSVQKVVFSESLPAAVFRTELPAGVFVQDEITQRCIKLDTGSGTGSRAMSVPEIREQTRRE